MQALIRNLKYPEYYLGPEAITRALESEADMLARAVAQIDGGARDMSPGELSPVFMPYVAAAIGCLALLLMAAARLTGGSSAAGQRALPSRSWLFIAAAVAVMAVGFTAMSVYGYLTGAAATIAGFLMLGRADLRVVIGGAILLPLLLWLLFSKLLGFPLP
jgi:FtsH-binding integral membrane protein